MNIAMICPAPKEFDGLKNTGKWPTPGNFVQHLCTLFDADYWTGNQIQGQETLDRLDGYDAVIINFNTNMYQVTCDLAQNLKHAKVIGHQDGSTDDISIMGMSSKKGLIAALRSVAAFAVYQSWADRFFTLFTDKPIRYTGFPAAPQEIVKHRKLASQRKQVIALGSPIGVGGSDRNGLVTAYTVNKAFPGMAMTALYYDEAEVDFARIALPALHLHRGLGQPDYWELISNAVLGVHLDHRYTFGRFALECACLRIPCIGTVGNGTQQALWPSLCVHPFMGTDHAVTLLRQLATAPQWREELCDRAERALASFTDEAVKMRWLNLLAELGIQ